MRVLNRVSSGTMMRNRTKSSLGCAMSSSKPPQPPPPPPQYDYTPLDGSNRPSTSQYVRVKAAARGNTTNAAAAGAPLPVHLRSLIDVQPSNNHNNKSNGKNARVKSGMRKLGTLRHDYRLNDYNHSDAAATAERILLNHNILTTQMIG